MDANQLSEIIKIQQIIVVRETRVDESRVALTPETLALLKSPHYQLLVESGAGLKAGFRDSDYIEAGAGIFSLSKEGYPANTLILRVKRAGKEREYSENMLFHKNTCMMGFLDPLAPGDHVIGWLKAGVTTLSLELFKSLSIDDPRNMQAAMSRIAGTLAFQDAFHRVLRDTPIKLTVIGTGPAAFSAVLEAKRARIPVQVFGRKEKYRNQFEAVDAVYHLIPEEIDQIRFIRKHLSDQNIVICAARSAGTKAPLLLDEESLKTLPTGSVIVDLTVNEGGSVVGSRNDQIVVSHGVSIIHVSGYPKFEPKIASEAYAQCLVKLLQGVLSPSGEILLNHELLRECWLTHEGVYNPSLKKIAE